MGTRTPWGTSDYSKKYAPGVIFYGTPSHGGYHLCATKNALVHEAWRRKDGWYEEDCDWAIVALTFPELFAEHLAHARSTAKNWYPDAYTVVTGLPVGLEDSSVLRKREFDAWHAKDFVVVAAWGDWAEGVPAGMVGVVATLGGDRAAPGAWFLVPAAEYEGRREFGFVIDPARHAECPKIVGRSKRAA